MLNSENWREELELLVKQRGNVSEKIKLGQRPFAKFSDVQELAMTMVANKEMTELFLEVKRLKEEGIPDDDERFMDIGSSLGAFTSWYRLKKNLAYPSIYLWAADHLARCAIFDGLDLRDLSAVSEALKSERARNSQYVDPPE